MIEVALLGISRALRGLKTSYHNNKNSSQNYNAILTKIKMKSKE